MSIVARSRARISVCLAGVLALLALGCGDGTSVGGGGGVTSPGTGTGTLRIDAGVSAEESANNAQVATQFGTDFTVNVTRAGAAVSGATITIGSSAGTVTLTETATPGTYAGAQGGYHQTYTLDVVAGADNVRGVRLVGPAFHRFSSPTEGATYPAGQPIAVNWAPGGAPEATVETRSMSETATADSGTFTVDASFLGGEPGRLEDERVRVRRTSRTPLAGGADDSELSIEVRNQVEFFVDAR
jgi:hypothetical protein